MRKRIIGIFLVIGLVSLASFGIALAVGISSSIDPIRIEKPE